MNMPLVILNRRRRGFTAFSPSTLFALAEPGVWYDPSDLATLYQDTAGTTPVTTPGQTVARMNDKSGRGNHATQPTIAARPTYSIEPVGGRRNLLTWSEDFGNADWAKSSVTAVSAQTVTYAGGLGTPNSRYIEQLKTIAGGTASKTFTISALVSGTGKIRLKGTQIGIADHYSANITLSSTPTLVQYTMTNSASSGTGVQAGGFVAATDDVAFTLTATNVQFELGSTATPYQRVTTQHDVTEAGVASLGYLYFDGASDNMVISTITPGIDKVQTFAGVRKLNNSTGAIAEFSFNFVSGGAFGLFCEGGPGAANNYFFGSGGTAFTTIIAAPFVAPITNVVTGIGNISGDLAALRANGTQVAQSTTDQGTGNYLAHPLYLGGRAGTSLFLSGHLYSLITRFGPTLDAPTIASTETWVAGKTGIVI